MKEGYDLPVGAPGQYMPLREDQNLPKAYFPERLPPEIDLSTAVIKENAKAMWALGRLEGLGSEIDNPGAVFSSFVYKEAEQSSQVEGTAVTVSDIYRYDIDQLRSPEPTDEEHEADVKEARNYIRALDEAVSFLQTAGFDRSSITTELIKSLHSTLLEDGRTDERDPLPGQFRPEFVAIEESSPRGFGTRIRFIPPKPQMVPGRMDDLEGFVQKESRWPLLVDIAIAHYQFETIHPFMDGNGRVGRLLVVLMLLADRTLHYPLLYLSSYIRQHRDEYTDLLLRVSEEGAWNEWLLFFLRGVRQQAEEAFVRARLLIAKRREYETRYLEEPKSVRNLAARLFEEPYFSVNEASDDLGVVFQTANRAVKQLEADGAVSEITGHKRHRVFRADEIMDIVESPTADLPSPDELIDVETAWNLPSSGQ